MKTLREQQATRPGPTIGSVVFKRPEVTRVECDGRTAITFDLFGESITIRPPDGEWEVHCFLCGAEWEGKWRDDGSPVYTGGTIRVRHYDHRVKRFGTRVAQGPWRHGIAACRCQAGIKMAGPGIPVADDTQWAAHKRRTRWIERAGVRMMREAAEQEARRLTVSRLIRPGRFFATEQERQVMA